MTITAFVTNLWANASADARADDPPADDRVAATGSEGATTGHDAQLASSPSLDSLAQFGAVRLHAGVQHFAYADKNGTSGGQTNSTTGTAQAKSAPVHQRTDQDLKEIARDPATAHQEWKSLGIVERGFVVDQMERRYGKDFAQKFLEAAKSGKTDFTTDTRNPPPIGPTRERLLELGYRFAGEEHTGTPWIVVHTWVHPSGTHIRMIVDTPNTNSPSVGPKSNGNSKPQETRPVRDPPVGEKRGPAADMPAYIDPRADRNKLFGPVVAFRDGVDTAFGEGDVQLHEKGAVEIFLEGTQGKSYLFVPIKGHDGLYAAYGPDGKRMGDQGWRLPPSDIPDRKADAVND